MPLDRNSDYEEYKIGECVEYYTESYNGGTYRYDRCINKGCVISRNDTRGTVSVIKQYGGQIWIGVTPYSRICEIDFLSKFSIYDEYTSELLEKIHLLPLHIRNTITDKIEKKKITSVFRMVLFCLQNKINYVLNYPKTSGIKIEDEVWGLKWYIINILRSHEPYMIRQTLDFCIGATDLIKEFMKLNIRFMIEMQFQSYEYSKIMHVLIQDKWLEFLYNKSLLDPLEYSSRMFKISKKKLETFLVFKQPIIEETTVSLLIYKDKRYYKLDTTLPELIDTKYVFVNSYNRYVSNKRSECSKKNIVNIKEWKTVNTDSKIGALLKRIDRPEFIEKDEYSTYYLNKQKNVVIKSRKYTIGSCSVDNYRLYLLENEKMIGSFEFNTDDEDLGCIFLEDNTLIKY